ncbi:MAG: YheU family protein [Oceanospirillaceae bacterium]|nr:YheU family protein [Oceanospirillaceae bacterium]MCP5335722.1 YheU family protein [Oceanospirillaceae bacterium]MCP5351229.1 YheU family protein [Oceanospirillaceae bacterium]
MMDDADYAPLALHDYIQVPYQNINPQTLEQLIEDVVTRDGTDYGAEEMSLAEKKAQALYNLQRGTAVVVFDNRSQTVTIVNKDSLF